MFKKFSFLVSLLLAFLSCNKEQAPCVTSVEEIHFPKTDSLEVVLNWPNDLNISAFSGPELTPSPACMAVKSTGEVFAGIDMIGSLGKDMGKGHIKRLIDCNHDGVLDSYTVFAEVDNPRGILAIGDQVFVLHTTFSKETQKADNMDLVVFEDMDNDGIADGPSKVLIKNISNSKYIQDRGTDHATNGIQMGIDGWIYIAVGDFGFYNATDRDGTKLTMLGGGIVRVRPDGTEMEVYSHGLRNIYDVAIDPYMNIFTRGNTNDGGGWNIRFIHQIQTGEYGYPVLFKHFTEEIIPALVDVGGGSGAGALFLNDDRWPEHYNNVPMMADWGRNYLFIHRVTEDKVSFVQDQERFIKLPQITDVDVDAAGAMYLSAWDGAGYSGSPDKGYLVRVTPNDFNYEPFEHPKDYFWTQSVVNLLKSTNAKTRLSAQYELISRKKGSNSALKMAKDKNLPLENRVASIFTYAQLEEADGVDNLVELTNDETVREFALRALADRKSNVASVPLEPFIAGLESGSDRVKAAAIIGLGRLGRKEAATALLSVPVPNSFVAPELGTEGLHARPNAEIILPHLAVKALVELNAVDACIKAIRTEQNDLALWALRYMHDSNAVDVLIGAYDKSTDVVDKNDLLNNLARIYYKEAPYDGSWWWSTRPDTHGPYYRVQPWEATEKIKETLVKAWESTPIGEQNLFASLNTKYRLGIEEFGTVDVTKPKVDAPLVDLEKIKNKKGQIGEASIEDVMIAIKQIKGNAELGEEIYKTQACTTCHSLKSTEVMKGPFMGQIGSIMNREQIAESILKPNASISQGFSTIQIKTNAGKVFVGFVTNESATEVSLTNITGATNPIKKSEIAERKELENSMMPAGLANSLSYEEMASLVTFLEQQK